MMKRVKPWIGDQRKFLWVRSLIAALAVCLVTTSLVSLAQDAPPDESTSNPEAPPEEEKLPDIKAKPYDVKVIRRSRSKKVYLIDDFQQGQPDIGRIILFKRDGENIMAFRVLKTYPEKKQFAAKRVRKYPPHETLNKDEQFLAIEKLGDIIFVPPTMQDEKDIQELESLEGELPPPEASAPPPLPEEAPLEGESPAPDESTLAEPPPPPAAEEPFPEGEGEEGFKEEQEQEPPQEEIPAEKSEPQVEEEEDPSYELLDLSAEEVYPFDLDYHWLTVSAAFLKNTNIDGTPFYSTGAGLRYGLTLKRNIFYFRNSAQDSLAVEGGIFMYKILGYAEEEDGYSLLPLTGTLRYTLFLNPDFGFFLYGGIIYTRVTGSIVSDETATATLTNTQPAIGGGLIFRVGPNWNIRVDMGYDMFAGGLMLRF